MKKIAILILFTVSFIFLQAQQTYTISGTITDKNTGMGIPSAGISIRNSSVGTFTDSIGHYELCHLREGYYTLLINYIGYRNEIIDISLNSDKQFDIELTPTDIALKEVEVKTNIAVTKTEIIRGPERDNPDANFLQVLNNLPGAATMNIGAGVAKPVIRGVSSNRVSVISGGVIQQNQQWGADHGLETNLFDIESATIHKGPYALLLGTSNIAALEITSFSFPNKYPQITGEAVLWGASNNDQLGSAFKAAWHNNNWYIRGSYRFMEYNDYRVPTDRVSYQDEDIALTNKRVPNTAGKEQSVSGTIGYRKSNVITLFTVSNNYQKTGLFELEHDHDHEHGEDDHDHDHDHDSPDTSHSNIGMPYSTSNHFSVSNITEWKTSTSRLTINTGYQNNHRKEFEHFHEHYEGQPAPDTSDDLSVDFKLQTYSSNIRLSLDEDKNWKKAISANIEYQQNRVGGFEYFLPRYNQVSGGLAFVNIYEPVETWKFQAGVRYDLAHTDITGFYDNILAEHLQEEGYESSIIQQYAQRAYDVNRNFGSFSGGISGQYLPDIDANGYLSLKLNLAKSLRFPSANELAANGVHHAAFRYEIGDPNLKAEHGYTIDFEAHYVNDSKLDILFNPFLTYYSNFIFLQPVAEPAIELYEEQPYKYSEAEAIYGGGEYKISWRPVKKLQLMTSGSIVLNRNIDNDKPLPFTPPFTMMNEIKFSDNTRSHRDISYYQISVSHQWYADQNRVGFGEEKTKGTNLFNVSAGIVYKINRKCSLDINMQVKNIFDTRYLNHMSLYRRLNIPEQGRNIQVFIRIPFNS